jgi:hypothetical protein
MSASVLVTMCLLQQCMVSMHYETQKPSFNFYLLPPQDDSTRQQVV